MKKLNILLVVLFAHSAAFCQTHWEQTSGSISFTIKNRGKAVHGKFGDLHTSIVFSPDKLASSHVKGSVEATTINTGIDKRDKDLQSETYFDTKKTKLIEVVSEKIEKKGDEYVATCKVTIKGTTRTETIPFQFIPEGGKAEFKGSMKINRRDYEVGNKSGLAMFMADEVQVDIDVKATKG